MSSGRNTIVFILTQLGLVVTASLLFTVSFPNIIFKNGLPFFAWFAYIPIIILIKKNSLSQCTGWGAIYGVLTYFLFNNWLWAFHNVAGAVVYTIYLFFLAIVFFFFKLADILYPKKVYLVQWIFFLAYEYLRTKGFLGYPYGITGYSQWTIIPLIQIASITGVWGVSALVTFPSFWLAEAFQNSFTQRNRIPLECSDIEKKKKKKYFIKKSFFLTLYNSAVIFFRKEKIPAIIWVGALAVSLVFGFFNIKDYSSCPSVQIALIQHNTDPWQASNAPTPWQRQEAFRTDLSRLKRLSDEALAVPPKPELVVWPETAFVPRIHWHSTYRTDQDLWLIVKDLLDYLSEKDIPFLIGNDDARMDPVKNPETIENNRVDYNAALLMERGQITQIYRKLHLVPFTEHFPYKKQLPFFYNALRNADTHFWEKGEEATIFRTENFNFSVPICFEDTFGYLSRNFTRLGADIFINISNDAWAASLPCQKQHLGMAVFRSIENNRSMVRSTASGQTCLIDPNGRILAEAAPFTEAYLNVAVPLAKGNTIYTRYGDFMGISFLFMAFILLLSPVVCYTIKKLIGGSR
ncbi:MAG: apolipoprotein N-acyltransferase [Treponema sp.]|nr:apolipoprotein N-acyltransferase [Treponema sp.]MCL2271884.1 apolipoprotein N-acyltransferase [Treponema sp.]